MLKKAVIQIFTTVICLFFLFSDYNILNSQTVEIPKIEYVTIDQMTQKPIIEWSIVDPSPLAGYSVKRLIYSHPSVADMTIHTIDTINDPFVFNYQDFTIVYGEALPGERFEKYGLVAFEIVGIDTFYSLISDYHNTLYLETNYEYCQNLNEITWNKYIGWSTDFIRYDIYSSINSGSFNKVGETNLNSDTLFLHNNVDYNTDYDYYVVAVRSDGIESVSNIGHTYTQSISFPTFLNTNSLIVDNNNQLSLNFEVENSADTESYTLYKSYDKNSEYSSIINFDNTSNQISFIDNEFVYDRKQYYFMAAKDYCDNIIFSSDTLNNIVLVADKNTNNNFETFLHWIDEENNNEYSLIRCIEDNCENIGYTFEFDYIDNIKDVINDQFINETTSGNICYYIEENDDGFYNRSNLDCVAQEEIYFLANAFNPNSHLSENRTFKPKIAFVTNYNLTIYGHLGNIVFNTSNPDVGWDGTLQNGKLAPRASYLYFLSFQNSSGKKIRKKSYVTLVY